MKQGSSTTRPVLDQPIHAAPLLTSTVLEFGDDLLVQIPITQQAGFPRAAERIAVRASAPVAPRKTAHGNDDEHDCKSNNTS
jgi:hypothetical protein